MQKYIERFMLKSIPHSFGKIEWFNEIEIGDLDYDMHVNMGGGIYFEGWYDMIEELKHLGPEYNSNYSGFNEGID